MANSKKSGPSPKHQILAALRNAHPNVANKFLLARWIQISSNDAEEKVYAAHIGKETVIAMKNSNQWIVKLEHW